jgi:hypothetical protein
MSVNIANARGGEFATTRRGGLDPYELAFIGQKLEAGVPVSAIAKMLGRPAQTIRDGLPPSFREAVRPEPSPPALIPPPPPIRAASVKTRPTPDRARRAIREVCDRHIVTWSEIMGPGRTKPVAQARQQAFVALAEMGFPLADIGRFFNRDHTTVLWGIRAHERRKASAAGVGRRRPEIHTSSTTVHSPKSLI